MNTMVKSLKDELQLLL